MRSLAAALLSAALAVHGVAAAAHPVACSRAGTVTSGRCCCDLDSGEPLLTASCGETLAAPAVASPLAPSTDLQPPAAAPTLALASLPAPVRPLAPWAPDAGPAPPLPILHRALLR
jgi:hypothetical protein